MKKFFQKLTATVAAFALLTVSLSADVVVYSATSTSTSSILQRGARVQQIIFSNAATNAITLTFYDAPTNVLTYVVGAYTNNVYSVSDVVSTYTNLSGVVNSTTNANPGNGFYKQLPNSSCSSCSC